MPRISEHPERRLIFRMGWKRIALLGAVGVGVGVWNVPHQGVAITFVNRTSIPLKFVHVALNEERTVEAEQLRPGGALSGHIPISGREGDVMHVDFSPREERLSPKSTGVSFGLMEPGRVSLELVRVGGAVDSREVALRVEYNPRPGLNSFLRRLWTKRNPFAPKPEPLVIEFQLPR